MPPIGYVYGWLDTLKTFELETSFRDLLGWCRRTTKITLAVRYSSVFILPVDMVEAVHEVRYTTGFIDLW